MNDDIRVVHHKDSGRMAENALRQRIDERTQLNEHKPEDVLRDTDATTMQDVATQEQRQTELLRFEENTPSYPQYEEESDPFETVFAQTGFEEPPIAPEPEPDRGLKPESREPLNNTDLKTEGTRAVASTLIADQSGKAGQAAPESASVQPVFTNPGTESPPESRSTEVQSSGQDYVTNRHIVPDISQPETAYENADSLFQTIYSETPFSQDTQRLRRVRKCRKKHLFRRGKNLTIREKNVPVWSVRLRNWKKRLPLWRKKSKRRRKNLRNRNMQAVIPNLVKYLLRLKKKNASFWNSWKSGKNWMRSRVR